MTPQSTRVFGYFKGTSPTTASPNDTLTREQAAVLLARNMMLQPTVGETLGFSDSRCGGGNIGVALGADGDELLADAVHDHAVGHHVAQDDAALAGVGATTPWATCTATSP